MTGIALADERRSRWIPWAFVAFFGVVLAVNLTMIVVAMVTWPGLETKNAYQRGLAYNRTLAAAAAQAALGWQVDFRFTPAADGTGLAELTLRDRHGNLLRGAEVVARFLRPTHAGQDVEVVLEPARDGEYRAAVRLPLPGQWQVRVDVRHGGHRHQLSERLHVRPPDRPAGRT
jgi:nitrogen fixation protein FixH